MSQRLLVPARCFGETSSELRSTYLLLPAAVIEPLCNHSYASSEEHVVHQPTGGEFENSTSHGGMLASMSKGMCNWCQKVEPCCKGFID